MDKIVKDIDVLGVGELNLDLMFTGLSGTPVPGREIIAKGMELVLGSSTAICAAGAARLGLRTAMCGVVGDDEFGRQAVGFLDEYGVDASGVRVDGSLRTGLTLSLAASGDRALVTYFGAISEMRADYVPDGLLRRARHLHVGSFFLQEKLRPGLPGLFAKARAYGASTSLDAGWDDTEDWGYGLDDTLAHTDYFFPNESEAKAITGIGAPERAAARLAGKCRIAVVKCGRDGACMNDGQISVRAPAYLDMEAIDTTGAGDSFNAGFIYASLAGYGYERRLRYGNACAAVCVTRVGGASGCARLADAEKVIATGRL